MTAQRRRVAPIVDDRLARWLRSAHSVLLVLAALGCATSVAQAQARADHGSSDV